MDLMVRTKVGLIRRPLVDPVEILTHDPTRPKEAISTISAILVVLTSLSLLFFLAVIVVWPFLLLWHTTPYPNLATVSFTTFLTAAAIFLITAYFSALLLFRWTVIHFCLGDVVLQIWTWLLKFLKWSAIVMFGVVAITFVASFIFFFGREATWWTITRNGPGYIWNAIQETLSSLIP
jgi:hypothetical protein